MQICFVEKYARHSNPPSSASKTAGSKAAGMEKSCTCYEKQILKYEMMPEKYDFITKRSIFKLLCRHFDCCSLGCVWYMPVLSYFRYCYCYCCTIFTIRMKNEHDFIWLFGLTTMAYSDISLRPDQYITFVWTIIVLEQRHFL